jgi:hypothetical protein
LSDWGGELVAAWDVSDRGEARRDPLDVASEITARADGWLRAAGEVLAPVMRRCGPVPSASQLGDVFRYRVGSGMLER